MNSDSKVINFSYDLSAQRIMVKNYIHTRLFFVHHLCIIVYSTF